MSIGFTILSQSYIRAWLASLVQRGGGWKMREGPTLGAIAKYCDIPKNDLIWYANKETSRMGLDRQRHLSKVIAQIENGQLDFEIQKNRKVAVLRESGKPRLRYTVDFSHQQPRLKMADRPPPFVPLPAFKGFSLK